MKLEEVNKRTKEAVDFLVAALESGHSEVLTAYLGAMAKFHTYSFGNVCPQATDVKSAAAVDNQKCPLNFLGWGLSKKNEQ